MSLFKISRNIKEDQYSLEMIILKKDCEAW